MIRFIITLLIIITDVFVLYFRRRRTQRWPWLRRISGWDVKEGSTQQINLQVISLLLLYSQWLGSRTTAVLFDPRMDLLPEAAGWGQQIRSKSQSKTVLLYTFIFPKCSYSLFPLTYPLDVFSILVCQVRESRRRLDIVTSISRDLLNQ